MTIEEIREKLDAAGNWCHIVVYTHMTTLKIGDFVRTRYDVKLLREGVTLNAGSVGMVSSVVASDAGYVRIGDNYVFFRASDLDANCEPPIQPLKCAICGNPTNPNSTHCSNH